jgi:hypothetical protein
VRAQSFDSDSTRLAPAERRIDIRRVRARHTDDVVVIRIRTTAPMQARRSLVGATIRTPSRSFDVLHGRLFGMVTDAVSHYLEKVPCEGFVATVHPRVVRFVVPTTCIESPAWVRVGIAGVRMRDRAMFMDDGLRAGVDQVRLLFNPKIGRG